VDKTAEVKVRLVELQDHPSAEIEAEIRAEVNRPFDLSTSPLLRATLLRVKPDEHVLVLNMHHIVSDEWSMKLFFREFAVLYAGFARGEKVTLPELSIQYGDFSVWQRDWMQGRVLEQQLSFWRAQMSGKPPITEWPADHCRRELSAHPAGNQRRVLSRELSHGVKELAERLEGTLFMVLLAAFKALLHRHTLQEDIVVGSPFAGRNRSETEQLIGFFVNALPLRTNLGGEPTFEELVRRVREVALGAAEHQDLPLEKLVEALQPERSLNHLPFTKLMFVVQNDVREELQLPGLKLRFETAESALAKFDLTFFVQETNHGLVTQIEYNADLFEPETITRLLQQFERLLEGSVANPKRRISELPLLSSADRLRLLVDWNRTATDYPRDKCIHELFEAQAKRTPQAIAVEFGTQTLTYAQLNERANQLARHLKQFDIRPDVLVGLCVERSVEMVVGLMAVLKAGGAYVPLDVNYPPERLAFMLADTRTPVLLTQQSLKSRLPAHLLEAQGKADSLAVVCLDTDWDVIGTESRENLPNPAKPESLAYVMYTSGSTGKPKGVAVPHRAVNRLVFNTNYIQLDATDRLAQVSNVSFDAATLEVWGSLLNGGRLVGISQEVALRPKEFASELRDRGITAMFLTSALFNQVAGEAPDAFNTLRTIMAGGEALDPKWVRVVLNHLKQALRQTRVVNGYGPTENTTFTCCHHITNVPEEASNIPIGRPISNTQVYILDTHLNPVPVGVPGELYAGGDGLARGYWNRAELTAEKFVPNPFLKELAPELNGDGAIRAPEKSSLASAEPSSADSPVMNPMHLSQTLYRTGDLARYLPDGTIEFLGRIDHQVKVRGFRIELGEIETVLGQHPGVRECVVIVRGQSAGERRLVAYFVGDKNGAPNASALRERLATKLPEYMVPAAFVPLEALPLTPNGKVDRAALPEPEQTRPELEPKYVAASDEVEVRLTKIWEDVLGVQPIGIRDNFFELGGHSLLAVRLSAQIEKSFGTKLRLATIFQAPTIAQLARHLRPETQAAEPPCQNSIVELHRGGTNPPLFLVHGAGGGMFWGYANLSRHLGPKQSVYGFKSRGLDGKEEFGSIEEMAAEYVADLRKVKPQGPYYLGGYCFGGNVAYEMARQLEGAGESVALLALMNCAPPNSRYGRINWSPLWWVRLFRNLIYWGHYFREWTPAQRSGFFRWKWRLLKRKLGAFFGAVTGRRSRGEVSSLVDLSSFTPEERKVWEAHIRALGLFNPRPYGGPIHLFRSPGHPLWCSFEPDYGWSEFARGGATITVVPGTHEKILEEPCVAVLAAELQKLLPQEEAGAALTPPRQLPEPGDRAMPLPSEGTFSIKQELPAPRAADLAYWKQQLSGAPALLELPTDHPRPAVQSCRTGIESQTLPLELAKELKALSQQLQTRCSDLFLAAVSILLQRYSRQDDILVGMQEEKLLALRVAVTGELTFPELLARLRATRAEAGRHASLAFEEIAAGLLPELPRSYHPIVQAAFSRSMAGIHDSVPGTGFDLTFQAVEELDALTLRLEYALDLFEPATIRRLLEHWETLLSSIVANPKGRLSGLEILPAAERRKVVSEWNSTAAEYPKQKTLFELFEEQVRRTPDAEALVCAGTQLTYAELHAQATAVAIHLRSLGVGKENLTGICLGRSEEMVIGILGTLQAGGAYVPLDPMYPRDRLAFMLEDAKVAVLLTQKKLLGSLPAGQAKVVCIEDLLSSDSHSGELAFGVHPLGCPPPANTLKRGHQTPLQDEDSVGAPGEAQPSRNLAYVIYTSGSTGRPKGVALEHRGAVALVSWARSWFSPAELAGVLASTSICFDLSIFELFVPLCTGGKVILAENALALPTLPAANQVTLINTVPSAMRELLRLKGVPPSVRVVNLAGEPLPTALVEQIYRETAAQKVYDLYGPTETTTYSTGALRQSSEPATIGRPLANEQVYLLDRHLQPVPIGVAGELFIGGDGLARGYLNRPELTAEKFITVSFAEEGSRRLYRTGDLARWRADGKLEYLGRLDHQVKIRGFRIELGEVEAALKKHPEVADAVVIARGEPFNKLVAYVVPQKGKPLGNEGLRTFLEKQLPHFMLPSDIVFLAELPLTPNGKLDRRALPAPEMLASPKPEHVVPPRNPVEAALVDIWREILHREDVGIHENFFHLGGHSLMATQVISRIGNTLGVELPLRSIFEAPTIARLAETVSAAKAENGNGPSVIKRAARVSNPEELLDRLEGLSDEEVEELLREFDSKQLTA
jgi:amino acid adenylation domain-containing protein